MKKCPPSRSCLSLSKCASGACCPCLASQASRPLLSNVQYSVFVCSMIINQFSTVSRSYCSPASTPKDQTARTRRVVWILKTAVRNTYNLYQLAKIPRTKPICISYLQLFCAHKVHDHFWVDILVQLACPNLRRSITRTAPSTS